MENIVKQAVNRFDRLWKTEGGKLLCGDITPSVMENGVIGPVDYCISTIARLIQQPHGGEMIFGVRSALAELFEAADAQFIYPDESLHVSLLGCTQREKTDAFDCGRIEKIKEVCAREIKRAEPAEILLKGVGIVGNQIFIQGIPLNRNWEALRAALDQELVKIGEKPISYEDKSPVHMNIIRIVNADSGMLKQLHKVISRLREVELGTVRLAVVEYVITDFGVSRRNVVWIDRMDIG